MGADPLWSGRALSEEQPAGRGAADGRAADGAASEGVAFEGYASLFWTADLNHDVAAAGCFADSLRRTGPEGVRMLHGHDAVTPVGVWEQLREDGRGLWVRGRVLEITPAGQAAAALLRAGVLDGLSIGFRTVRSRRDGRLRVLSAVDLWEVSLVVFPMLPGARLRVVR